MFHAIFGLRQEAIKKVRHTFGNLQKGCTCKGVNNIDTLLSTFKNAPCTRARSDLHLVDGL